MKTAVPTIRVRGLAHWPALFDRHRLEREQRTMDVMLAIYCRDQHGHADGLCTECAMLREYAKLRLERCRFGCHKPTCAHCPVHCYQPRWRARVQEMMRYAGPRMLWRHPLLALMHICDGWREPEATRNGAAAKEPASRSLPLEESDSHSQFPV